MELYRSAKLSEAVTEILDVADTRIFLIEGSKRAAVIDTGVGIGNLKEYVDQLTTLPYIVICTHGHMDHAGCCGVFDEVYLNSADWQVEKRHCTLQNQKDYTELVMGDRAKEIPEEAYMPARQTPFKELRNGQLFDLGGITLEMVALPGHTHGMMCVLIREERTMIFGDGCNPRIFLFDQDSTSVAEFRENLIEFQNRESDYDHVYLSHGPALMPKSMLEESIEVCDRILNGTDDKVPFHFMKESGTQAIADTPNGLANGKLVNIIYNSNHIR